MTLNGNLELCLFANYVTSDGYCNHDGASIALATAFMWRYMGYSSISADFSTQCRYQTDGSAPIGLVVTLDRNIEHCVSADFGTKRLIRTMAVPLGAIAVPLFVALLAILEHKPLGSARKTLSTPTTAPCSLTMTIRAHDACCGSRDKSAS